MMNKTADKKGKVFRNARNRIVDTDKALFNETNDRKYAQNRLAETKKDLSEYKRVLSSTVDKSFLKQVQHEVGRELGIEFAKILVSELSKMDLSQVYVKEDLCLGNMQHPDTIAMYTRLFLPRMELNRDVLMDLHQFRMRREYEFNDRSIY